ncbi:TPA: hypothetical protein OT511_001411 [Escherichia coli]|nr:hypothetical protein [Escherichia coli]
MKIKMLIASALLVSSFSAVATSEVCKNIGDIALNTADARDNGISKNLAEVVVKGAAKNNEAAEMIGLAIVEMVYARKDMTKEQLRNVAVTLCEKQGM